MALFPFFVSVFDALIKFKRTVNICNPLCFKEDFLLMKKLSFLQFLCFLYYL